MDNRLESFFKESPVDSKENMPSFAAEELIRSLMEFDQIAEDQSDHSVEICIILERRPQSVKSW